MAKTRGESNPYVTGGAIIGGVINVVGAVRTYDFRSPEGLPRGVGYFVGGLLMGALIGG